MNDQINLFRTSDAFGTLKPVEPTPEPNIDPYLNQKSRTNDIKRIHYDNHVNSEKGARQIDMIFVILDAKGECTDREIQYYYEGTFHKSIDIGTIPARRADITNDKEYYKKWRIVKSRHRECSIMKTIKCAWILERIVGV